MVAEVFAGIGAFGSMMDIVKTLKDMDSAVARNAAVIELQDKIFAAQVAQSSLLERIGELERKIAGFEKWEAEKQRYELVALYDGALAYVVKEVMQGTEPVHYICATCYQTDQKSVLQGTTWHLGEHSLECPVCKTKVVHSWRETR